jgi:hypothetical protein
MSGLGWGDGPVAVVTALLTLGLVWYLAIARPDIQRAAKAPADGEHVKSSTSDYVTGGLEFNVE